MPLVLLGGSAVSPAPRAEPPPTSAGFAQQLAGLWKARRNFGPEVQGTLVVRRFATGYLADIAGVSLPVEKTGNGLRFALPDGAGSFRGSLSLEGIHGFWITPAYVGYGFNYALPVHLANRAAGIWQGEVRPLADTFTFYLLITRTPDGQLAAVLHNPERDWGAFLGVERLEHANEQVMLLARKPGWQAERVVASGRYHADEGVLSLYFSRGGTFDFRRDGDESDFYPRGRAPQPYDYRIPLARVDGWSTASLDAVGIDRKAVERFIQKIIDTPMAAGDAPQVQAVLIARHGKLVLEEYFHGFARDSMHETRSAAKSITAALIGAALHAGVPLSLSSRLYAVLNGGTFPEGLEARKREITLSNLMNMSSGFDCDDANPESAGSEDRMYDSDATDYVTYGLALPMAFTPGEKAVYCTQDANLALAMLGRASGHFAPALFDQLIARPLRIERYQWLVDPAGNAFGGGSVKMLPRDFLKIGQLMLNGGVWHGRRILERRFAAAATAPQYHLRNVTYGYFWWSIDLPYKDRTVRAIYAGGAGGQTVILVPELDLVVGIFAGNYSSKAWKDVALNYTPRYVLPAIREAGDQADAPTVWREDYATPYGPSQNTGPVTPIPMH